MLSIPLLINMLLESIYYHRAILYCIRAHPGKNREGNNIKKKKKGENVKMEVREGQQQRF